MTVDLLLMILVNSGEIARAQNTLKWVFKATFLYKFGPKHELTNLRSVSLRIPRFSNF